MSALALLVELCRARFVLDVAGEELKVKAPPGVTIPIDAIRQHKLDLLAILADIGPLAGAASVLVSIDDDPHRADLLERFEERASIGEYEGGLARSDAEALALDELLRATGQVIFADEKRTNAGSHSPAPGAPPAKDPTGEGVSHAA